MIQVLFKALSKPVHFPNLLTQILQILNRLRELSFKVWYWLECLVCLTLADHVVKKRNVVLLLFRLVWFIHRVQNFLSAAICLLSITDLLQYVFNKTDLSLMVKFQLANFDQFLRLLVLRELLELSLIEVVEAHLPLHESQLVFQDRNGFNLGV